MQMGHSRCSSSWMSPKSLDLPCKTTAMRWSTADATSLLHACLCLPRASLTTNGRQPVKTLTAHVCQSNLRRAAWGRDPG